jgi:NADH:ubiquinone oxidoreductase subunit 4 (subunit M)
LILGNLSFPGTLNFIGELFSIVSLGNIDYSLVSLVLLNVLLTSCYSFFTMSIVYLVGQSASSCHSIYKDTNRIECSFMFLLFGIIAYYNTTDCNPCATAGCFGIKGYVFIYLPSLI